MIQRHLKQCYRSQTLLPPSVADGERREWDGDNIEPAVFDAAKLRRRCAYLAIGCLIRRYVSEQTSERPAPDLPHLLHEADPILGRAGYFCANSKATKLIEDYGFLPALTCGSIS